MKIYKTINNINNTDIYYCTTVENTDLSIGQLRFFGGDECPIYLPYQTDQLLLGQSSIHGEKY